MSERITLMGSEQVQSAGNRMMSAANEMHRAASNMEAALQQHQRFMDNWLINLQRIMEQKS